MSTSPRPVAAELTFDDLIATVRRTWRSALAWGAVALCVAVVVAVVRQKSYTARASFVGEQDRVRSLPAGLTSLAGQFGLGIGGDAGRSPQFYRNLVETSGILIAILDSVVQVAPGDSVSVRGLLRGEANNSRANLDRLLRRLRTDVSAQVDPRTAVVTLMVSAKTPTAAEGVAGLLIRSIKHFNVTTRQLQAGELRIFLESRVADALQGLHEAEDELRTFYQRNRRLGDSPQLMFEETRMKRQIELRQELYTTLSRELESARIDEVNDTPTITVIDPPLASSRPNGPSIVALAAIGALLGACARAAWLVIARR